MSGRKRRGAISPTAPTAKRTRARAQDEKKSLVQLEEALWSSNCTVDAIGTEQLRLLPVKMNGIAQHTAVCPGDFQPACTAAAAALRSWTRDIRIVSHRDEHGFDENRKSANIKLQLRNGHQLLIYVTLDVYWSILVDITVIDSKRVNKPVLEIRDACLFNFDEEMWDSMIAGEIPGEKLEVPGSSFLLRFFCFLCLGHWIDSKRCFDEIATAVGTDFGRPERTDVYERYPFFQEYWRYFRHHVLSALSPDASTQPLLPVLTDIVLDYAPRHK